MTHLNKGLTMSELEVSTPLGRREMSVARLSLRVALLLSRALKASGRSQKELAAELGLSEGRVSQVLNGDGNVRVSTLARFMMAMGYEVTLDARPVEEDLPAISGRRRIRQRHQTLRESVYLQFVGGSSGAVLHRITIVPDGAPVKGNSLSNPVLVGTVDSVRSSLALTGANLASFAIEGAN